MIHRLKIGIQGTVQGIGFRPFVYNLAHEKKLRGYVSNTSIGVDIEVEGESTQLDFFIEAIKSNRLPLAHIAKIQMTAVAPQKNEGFVIKESESHVNKITSIPPDICICEDCLKEMQNPGDRRYRYPFINCTNCGPRYTIIEDVPYDRPYTSMRKFTMCGDCLKEYMDPSNRRFHAQPNACPVCGPGVTLYDSSQNALKGNDPISSAIDLLKRGHIIAVKGLGGFHLAVDAEDNRAVMQLRARKQREEKPLALMAYNMDRIRRFAHVNPEEEVLLRSSSRPIVILKKRIPNSISPEISPNNQYFGVMLPYTPLHYLLLDSDISALVMTSGNVGKEPISIDNGDAFLRLGNIADFFLVHDRDIYLRTDDSIARSNDNQARIIRRARGYAPSPVYLKKDFPQILACGAETANTVCLTKGNQAIMSQHIGDLTNLESLNAFEQTISHLKRIFDIEPILVAHDLHPDYLSTQYALKETKGKKVGVQHHHSHIVSCMAEHGIEKPVIGLAFDGTGYGTDGRIWGGEVLLARVDRFDRLAHFGYIPMPGGNAAIEEPWRMAVSYLYHAFDETFWNLKLPLFEHIEKGKIRFILEMIKKGVNCPETSSLGRLFDGISSILGIRQKVSYEGQAAVELEMAITASEETPYPYEYIKERKVYLISTSPIIKAIVHDMQRGKSVGNIGLRFHLTLIRLFSDLCMVLREETGCNRVVLSGGVFQNAHLSSGLGKTLKENGFDIFAHAKVPTNDGGISLGQAAIAAAVYRKHLTG
ncbi:MAG: carbamoyltransferase HypF [Desulfobacteraceae bacterium]|nr:carbamoyltransferase HypF [Desulfobacteraceae bacterium]